MDKEFTKNISINSGIFNLNIRFNKIIRIDIKFGANHRGVEKLLETKNFHQAIPLAERICCRCSVSNAFAYVMAVEDLASVKIPEKAKYIRNIAAELERIISHLLWLGRMCSFLGYDKNEVKFWRLREPLLLWCEKVFGSRSHYGIMSIGGVNKDIFSDQGQMIKNELIKLLSKINKLKKQIVEDPIFLSRLE